MAPESAQSKANNASDILLRFLTALRTWRGHDGGWSLDVLRVAERGGGVAGQMVSPFLVRQIVESGLHFHLRAQFIWLRHHEEVSSSSHGQNRKLCSGSAASSFLLLFFFLRKNPVTPFYFPFFIWFLLAWLCSGPIFGGWALFVVSLPRSVLFFRFLVEEMWLLLRQFVYPQIVINYSGQMQGPDNSNWSKRCPFHFCFWFG